MLVRMFATHCQSCPHALLESELELLELELEELPLLDVTIRRLQVACISLSRYISLRRLICSQINSGTWWGMPHAREWSEP